MGSPRLVSLRVALTHLEVAADEQELDLCPPLVLGPCKRAIDGVELAVAAALDGDLGTVGQVNMGYLAGRRVGTYMHGRRPGRTCSKPLLPDFWKRRHLLL